MLISEKELIDISYQRLKKTNELHRKQFYIF